ncbi:MAG: hypothetical protein H7Y22_01975 [Gemmatimonadaceae bacterium]|nr:hypothetical protein [Gloeobacterales cyanobacterium ES-bin-141]
MRKRIDEQWWFRAAGGLIATVALGLMLNRLAPTLSRAPVVGEAFLQLCRVVNANCEDRGTLTAAVREESLASRPPAPPPPPKPQDRQTPTVDLKGNSLGTAKEIDDLDEAPTQTGSVSTADQEDFYRFSLSDISTFNLLLDGQVAHALLLDSNGDKIRAAQRTTAGEAINYSLKAGTYYVRVQAAKAQQGPYNLRLSAQSLQSREDDDTLSTARDLDELDDDPVNLKDWVGYADEEDFYRFSLDAERQFTVLLDSKVANISLLNSSGEKLARGKRTDVGEAIALRLGAGTYYLQVQKASREGTYHLNLATSS